MTRLLPILFLLASVTLSHGATNYVRAGAGGSRTGADWTHAYTNIPATMVRGDTYYVAEGNYGYVDAGGAPLWYSYGAYEFNDNVSSDTLITLRKATVADHGTTTGWSDSYGDGQAAFVGGVTFWDSYYVIDGNGRNESNWQDGASYGFYIPSINVDTGNGQNGSRVTLRHVELGDPYTETEQAGYGIAIKLMYTTITNWTISQCYIHNYGRADAGIKLSGANFLIESNYFGPGWGKEAIRGSGVTSNTVIRYNIFRDAIITAVVDPPDGAGMTAEIAIWDDGGGPSFTDISIYGNVFTNRFSNTRNGVILLGPFDTPANPGEADNARIYNNTFIGILDTTAYSMISVHGTNAHVANNLFFNCAESDISVTNGTTANNLAIGSNVFSGYTITAAIPGTSLSDPYNRDPIGVTRGADDVFDIGAYEYSAGGGGDPAPSGSVWNVTNLRIGQ